MSKPTDEAQEPGDWDELTELLWKAARKGNVPAMRILRDEMIVAREGKPAGSVIDELAKRREAI